MSKCFLYRPKKVGENVNPKNVHESRGILWESRLFMGEDIMLAKEDGWQVDMASPILEDMVKEGNKGGSGGKRGRPRN